MNNQNILLSGAIPTFIPYASVEYDVIVEVVFGSPLRQCAGNGICAMVEALPGRRAITGWQCSSAMAQLISISGGPLVMKVYKATIPVKTYKQQFSDPYFQVDADFDLGLVIYSTGGRLIKQGRYKYFEDRDHVYIDFSVRVRGLD